MLRKYIIPLVALAGVAFAIFTVASGNKQPPAVPPVSEASQSPYATFVAGSGIVEAGTDNISIGTGIAGVVSEVFVHVGSDVKAGEPLFKIDDRAARAELEVRRATAHVAEVQSANAQYELMLGKSLAETRNISEEELAGKRFAVEESAARLAQARAELKAGETNLEILTVRAPVDGQVLQLRIHPGEFVPVGAGPLDQQPLLLMGSLTPLHVRVDVDEFDAWRVTKDASATGFLRGNASVSTSLNFVRFEPYVVPKKSLTGNSTERVDTRVLQVIFSFERGDLPIYVGQQMDVFIETSEPAGSDNANAGADGRR